MASVPVNKQVPTLSGTSFLAGAKSSLSFLSSLSGWFSRQFTDISNRFNKNTWIEEAQKGDIQSAQKFLAAFPEDKKSRNSLVMKSLEYPDVIKLLVKKGVDADVREKALVGAVRHQGEGRVKTIRTLLASKKPIPLLGRQQAYKAAAENKDAELLEFFQRKKLFSPQERESLFSAMSRQAETTVVLQLLKEGGIKPEARVASLAAHLSTSMPIPQFKNILCGSGNSFPQVERAAALRSALQLEKNADKVSMALLNTQLYHEKSWLDEAQRLTLLEEIFGREKTLFASADVVLKCVKDIPPGNIARELRENIANFAAENNHLELLQWAAAPGLPEAVVTSGVVWHSMQAQHAKTLEAFNPKLLAVFAEAGMNRYAREELLLTYPWATHPQQQSSMRLLSKLLSDEVTSPVRNQLFLDHISKPREQWNLPFIQRMLMGGKLLPENIETLLCKPGIMQEATLPLARMAAQQLDVPTRNQLFHQHLALSPEQWNQSYLRLLIRNGVSEHVEAQLWERCIEAGCPELLNILIESVAEPLLSSAKPIPKQEEKSQSPANRKVRFSEWVEVQKFTKPREVNENSFSRWQDGDSGERKPVAARIHDSWVNDMNGGSREKNSKPASRIHDSWVDDMNGGSREKNPRYAARIDFSWKQYISEEAQGKENRGV